MGDLRAAVQAALNRLVDLSLGRGVQVSPQQTQNLLGAGRYSDGLIRVPTERSGFALMHLQLD